MTAEDPAGTSADPGNVRVLIVDDQKVVREGLVSLIGLLPGITIVGAAIDGDDAVRQAVELRPDVVLMDLNMPRRNGVEATEQLRGLLPDTAVVVLTTYSDDAWVFAALQAGARGFLTKDAGADEILRAITDVAAGHAQLDPAVQRRLLDALSTGDRFAVAETTGTAAQAPQPGPFGPSGPAGGTGEPPDGLTPREVEVLARIAAGLSNAEIAAVLYVSEATVKTHVNHIFGKTGLRDRAQLVGYAFRNGLASAQLVPLAGWPIHPRVDAAKSTPEPMARRLPLHRVATVRGTDRTTPIRGMSAMDTPNRGFPRGDFRVSDADRDRAVAELSEHFQTGRLTQEEFEDRSGRALQARTGSELSALFSDLPQRLAPFAGRLPESASPRGVRHGLRVPVAGVIAACVVGSIIVGNVFGSVHHVHGASFGWLVPVLILGFVFRRVACGRR